MPPSWRSPATWCCSRRPVRASTATATTPIAATSSSPPCRHWPEPAAVRPRWSDRRRPSHHVRPTVNTMIRCRRSCPIAVFDPSRLAAVRGQRVAGHRAGTRLRRSRPARGDCCSTPRTPSSRSSTTCAPSGRAVSAWTSTTRPPRRRTPSPSPSASYVIDSAGTVDRRRHDARPHHPRQPVDRLDGGAGVGGFPAAGPGRSAARFDVCRRHGRARLARDVDVEVLRVLSCAAAREIATRTAAPAGDRRRGTTATWRSRASSCSPRSPALGRPRRGTSPKRWRAWRGMVVPILGDWSVVTLCDTDGLGNLSGAMRDVGWWHQSTPPAGAARRRVRHRPLAWSRRAAPPTTALATRAPVVVTENATSRRASMRCTRTIARDAWAQLQPRAASRSSR